MKLAKLILHYNTPELTNKLCLMIPDAIVIDNGSSKPYTGRNRRIKFDQNYGFTKGWNEAIKQLFDEFDAFWLMNSDITVGGRCILRVEEVLRTNPEVMMFTPTYNCWMDHCRPKNKSGLHETNLIEFTAPIIQKSVFEAIGFFDELFIRGYGVEFDFCYRMRQAGLKIFVDHNSTFNHIGQQTIKKNAGGLHSYSREANFELTRGLSSIYGHDWISVVLENCNIKTSFKMDLCVYTTIFGDYDSPKLWPEQTINADYYIITDNPNLTATGWKTIYVDTPRKDLHPRLRAKFYKMFPWEVKELAAARITVFVDASIQVKSKNFLDLCIREMKNDMLLFNHPQRNCIYDEAKASLELHKYQTENIQGQINFYKTFHPAKAGLYACGVMVRRKTPVIESLMGAWWWENLKYSWQDQLSFPVVCRMIGFKPSTFSCNQYKNEYFDVKWKDDSIPQPSREIGTGLKMGAKEQDEIGGVTVLMPVKDTPVELMKQAVESILNQTYKAFTLLIVDDASKNEDLLQYFRELIVRDARVRICHRIESTGLASALDCGIMYINDDHLIIRMDSDDIALPTLIENHVNYFSSHPECKIRGVQIRLFTPQKEWDYKHPEIVTKDHYMVKNYFWFTNHPGIAYYKSLVQLVGGYGDTPKDFAEDYVLWCKILATGETIYNSEETLLRYRAGDGSQIGQDRKGDAWNEHLKNTRKKYLGF